MYLYLFILIWFGATDVTKPYKFAGSWKGLREATLAAKRLRPNRPGRI